MADSIYLAQQREHDERERHINAARAKKPGVSRVLCAACDAPIPSARRRALPGVQCCVTCQEIAELKGRHYNGGAV
ncbi:TraR/DksA family transcriptional regulator [Enterobacter sp.]|uniref:TraR/DksA family transcriptional regulator n=1 Tax=Enterobacter sp. TaxID=42895 RepID=UPI00296F207F|nr:TraR/DksA family transcriptional regulator [Enterobacter sp.]